MKSVFSFLCFLAFVAVSFAQTPAPTDSPTVEPTSTGVPTISSAPFSQPTADTVEGCFENVRDECNCALFFRGSKCIEEIFDELCTVPNRKYTDVKKMYRKYCKNPNKVAKTYSSSSSD